MKKDFGHSMARENGSPERTSKGNPWQLTIWQHVFPSASINRFTDASGQVDLDHFVYGKRLTVPKDNVFCAKRAWDQKSETGHKRSIEDPFQRIATEIIESELTSLSHEQGWHVSNFMALWLLRVEHRDRHDNIGHTRLTGEQPLNLENEEILERNGYTFIRPDGTIPSRFMNSIGITVRLGAILRENFVNHQWGIVHASAVEFLVPDRPAYSVLPISPTICLSYQNASGFLPAAAVTELNKTLRKSCDKCCFSCDLQKCFLYIKLNT